MGDTCMREGALAVGEPSPGTGPLQHPLPNLSEQDAARITRLLADERAELEAQSARVGLPRGRIHYDDALLADGG